MLWDTKRNRSDRLLEIKSSDDPIITVNVAALRAWIGRILLF